MAEHEKSDNPNHVTTKQLAEFTKFSVRRIQQLVQEGTVKRVPDKRGLYLFLESLQAIIHRQVAKYSEIKIQKEEAALFKIQEEGATVAVKRAQLEKLLAVKEDVFEGMSQYVISVVKIQNALADNIERDWPNIPTSARVHVDELVAHAQKAGEVLRVTGTYEMVTAEPGDEEPEEDVIDEPEL